MFIYETEEEKRLQRQFDRKDMVRAQHEWNEINDVDVEEIYTPQQLKSLYACD